MIKIGSDLLYIKRFEKNLDNPSFLDKVFHISELKHKNKLASMFALKEATMKALGKKTNWKNILVTYDKHGKPNVSLNDAIKPKNLKEIQCTVSHDKDYLQAFVILTG